jgi:NAD(P)-dependent dehydrogenase (short-subunit alcohol dehydrogenase family)
MSLDLTDARVVISGAASNIGRSIVHAFAAEGARIVINDINGPRAEIVRDEAEELGAAQVHLAIADLALPGAAEAVIGAARVAWGGLDAAICRGQRQWQ